MSEKLKNKRVNKLCNELPNKDSCVFFKFLGLIYKLRSTESLIHYVALVTAYIIS